MRKLLWLLLIPAALFVAVQSCSKNDGGEKYTPTVADSISGKWTVDSVLFITSYFNTSGLDSITITKRLTSISSINIIRLPTGDITVTMPNVLSEIDSIDTLYTNINPGQYPDCFVNNTMLDSIDEITKNYYRSLLCADYSNPNKIEKNKKITYRRDLDYTYTKRYYVRYRFYIKQRN